MQWDNRKVQHALLAMIWAYIKGQQRNWDLNLGCLAGAYRATPNESTTLTPNMLMLGMEVRLPFEVVYDGSVLNKLGPSTIARHIYVSLDHNAWVTARCQTLSWTNADLSPRNEHELDPNLCVFIEHYNVRKPVNILPAFCWWTLRLTSLKIDPGFTASCAKSLFCNIVKSRCLSDPSLATDSQWLPCDSMSGSGGGVATCKCKPAQTNILSQTTPHTKYVAGDFSRLVAACSPGL